MKPSELEVGATYTAKGTAGYVVRRFIAIDGDCVKFTEFNCGRWECEKNMKTERFLRTQEPTASPLDCRELLAAKARVAELENVERLRMEYVACPHHADDAAKNAWTSAREAAFKGVL